MQEGVQQEETRAFVLMCPCSESRALRAYLGTGEMTLQQRLGVTPQVRVPEGTS